ncbi:hypothetical protein BASA62_002758 [Batrachochytrium salamandrivorans]|nr:hypothetical protein BASA62_002758 [Batrachochytrium salamandrivorans]
MQAPTKQALFLGRLNTGGSSGFQCIDLKTGRLFATHKVKPCPVDPNALADEVRKISNVIGLSADHFNDDVPTSISSSTPSAQSPTTAPLATPIAAPPPSAPQSPAPPPSAPQSPTAPPTPAVEPPTSQAPEPALCWELPFWVQVIPLHDGNTITVVRITDSQQLPVQPAGPVPTQPALPPLKPGYRYNRYERPVYSKELARAIQQGGPGFGGYAHSNFALAAQVMRDNQVEQHMQQESLAKEIAAFLDSNAVVPIKSPPKGVKVIYSKAFGKVVLDAKGSPVGYKTRLVVRGDQQVSDFPADLATSNPGFEQTCFLLQAAVSKGMEVISLDVKAAYLNSPLEEKIITRVSKEVAAEFCRQNESYQEYLLPDGTLYLRLLKSIYGLRQSPLNFQLYSTTKLAEHGFHPAESARSLYVKTLPDGQQHWLLLFWTGARICPTWDWISTNKYTTVKQPGFINEILEAAGVINETTSPLPYFANLFQQSPESPLLNAAELKRFVSHEASLRNTTRLGQSARGTSLAPKTGGLTFWKSDLTLHAQADASHGLHDDARSQLGHSLWLGSPESAPFATSCKKGASAATSSTHAEALSLFRSGVDVMPYRWLCEQLGFAQTQPTPIGQDNESTVTIIERGSGWGGKSRIFELKLFWLTDCIRAKYIALHHVPSQELVPDGFTKCLEGARFPNWREAVLGKPPRESYSQALTHNLSYPNTAH